MAGLSDDALRALFRANPAEAWRVFIDQYTPLIVGTIRRAGLTDRDEQMDVYVQVCEQLSANGFGRFQSQDAARGSIASWLTVVSRNAVVDWIRSKRGRRRLFRAIQKLSAFDQRVFELYYWDNYSPSEITELLPQPEGLHAAFATVLESLERVQSCLTERHRAELLAMATRSHAAVAIDDTNAAIEIQDPLPQPDAAVRATQLKEQLEVALTQFSAEDAAIIRLKYFDGLTTDDVVHALGLDSLTNERLKQILVRLRTLLARIGVTAGEPAFGRAASKKGTQ